MIDCISSITPYLTLTQSFSSCRPQCLLGERRNAGRMGERSGEAASRDFLALTRIGSCGDQDLRPTVSVVLTVNVALPPVNSLRFTPASGNSKRGKSHDCNCHRIRLQRFPSYTAEVGEQRHSLGYVQCLAFHLQKEEALGPFRAASSASASLFRQGDPMTSDTHASLRDKLSLCQPRR